MRRSNTLVATLGAIALPAAAQFASPVWQLADTCYFIPGTPIELTLYLDCPPSGNPQMYCNGPQTMSFTSDDPNAVLPPPITLVPNQMVRSGPITLRKRNSLVNINFVGTQDGHDFGAKTCSSKPAARNAPR